MNNVLSRLVINRIIKKALPVPLTVATASRLTAAQVGRAFLASMNHRDYFGRYSILTLQPLINARYQLGNFTVTCRDMVTTTTMPIFDALDMLCKPIPGGMQEGSPYSGLWTGYISYDAARHFEYFKLPEHRFFETPDFSFTFSDSYIVIDHFDQSHHLILLETDLSEGTLESRTKDILDAIKQANDMPLFSDLAEDMVQIEAHITKERYLHAMDTIHDYIRRGEFYQVNYTYPLSMHTATPSSTLFLEYTRRNPVDFAAFLNEGDLEFLSISPECFFTLYDSIVKSYPIKGTIRRGATEEEDIALRKELLASDKDMAELSMIVDLIRNDIGRVAEIGSVKVKQHASIETFKTLHHLYSLVQGKVKGSRAALIRSMFPGGSITGAPKIRAMEVISELEPWRRGIYTGAIGWIGSAKDMAFNIAIRTVQKKGDFCAYFVGGGIVWDSEPEKEFQETLTKARSFHNIFNSAQFSVAKNAL